MDSEVQTQVFVPEIQVMKEIDNDDHIFDKFELLSY